MENQKYDPLKLENQLCFPLYAAAREVVKLYRPCLEELDLTYTQYIAMLVLWQCGRSSVKELGEKLYLDSGTLTPVLKSLEKKGFITRSRSVQDERVLTVEVSPEGNRLRDRALSVPRQMIGCLHLSEEEYFPLYTLLYKLLGNEE